VDELNGLLASMQTYSGHPDTVDASIGQILKGHFFAKDVYTRVPIQDSYEQTGKGPVPVKWVDTNKGDDADPNCRSRLVAKDVRRKRRTLSLHLHFH